VAFRPSACVLVDRRLVGWLVISCGLRLAIRARINPSINSSIDVNNQSVVASKCGRLPRPFIPTSSFSSKVKPSLACNGHISNKCGHICYILPVHFRHFADFWVYA
jgi:hypothetical protein